MTIIMIGQTHSKSIQFSVSEIHQFYIIIIIIITLLKTTPVRRSQQDWGSCWDHAHIIIIIMPPTHIIIHIHTHCGYSKSMQTNHVLSIGGPLPILLTQSTTYIHLCVCVWVYVCVCVCVYYVCGWRNVCACVCVVSKCVCVFSFVWILCVCMWTFECMYEHGREGGREGGRRKEECEYNNLNMHFNKHDSVLMLYIVLLIRCLANTL